MSSGVDGVQRVLLPAILPVDLDKAKEVQASDKEMTQMVLLV